MCSGWSNTKSLNVIKKKLKCQNKNMANDI